MRAIEGLGSRNFTLSEVYECTRALQAAFPDNNNPRAKIRQQLQLLRDQRYLDFLGNGHYELVLPNTG